ELQRLATGRKAQGIEGIYDLLRELGPMSEDELTARHEGTADEIRTWLQQLIDDKRVFVAVIAGIPRLACMDDATSLRDALGVHLPPSLPQAWLHPVNTPLRDLFLRYSRTHALFTTAQIAEAFGLGIVVAD